MSHEISGYTSGASLQHIGQVVSVDDPLRAGRVQVQFPHDPDGATNLRWVRPQVGIHFPQTVNSANGGKQGTGISPTGITKDAWVMCTSHDKESEQYTYHSVLTGSGQSEGDKSGKNDVIHQAKEPQYDGGDPHYKKAEQQYDRTISTPQHGVLQAQNNLGQTTAKEVQASSTFTMGRNFAYA